jgi:hypothetical protein
MRARQTRKPERRVDATAGETQATARAQDYLRKTGAQILLPQLIFFMQFCGNSFAASNEVT